MKTTAPETGRCVRVGLTTDPFGSNLSAYWKRSESLSPAILKIWRIKSRPAIEPGRDIGSSATMLASQFKPLKGLRFFCS